VVIADFNLDNTNDFAVALSDVSQVKTYMGDGVGGFVMKGSVSAGGNGYPVHLSVGNLNYATDPYSGLTAPAAPLDVVASAYSNKTGRAYIGSSSGTIAPSSAIDLLGMRPVWSVIGDVNGDGFNDIVFVCRDDDKISMWSGDGSGSFTFLANYGSSASSVARPFNPAVVHPPPARERIPGL